MYKEIYIPIIDKLFERKVITAITWDDECWFCNSHVKDKDGYHKIHFNAIDTRVHRVMYKYFKGNIPDGLIVRHTCDHPGCINPDHLVLGTPADNARDRIIHGNIHKYHTTRNPKLKRAPDKPSINARQIKIKKKSKENN